MNKKNLVFLFLSIGLIACEGPNVNKAPENNRNNTPELKQEKFTIKSGVYSGVTITVEGVKVTAMTHEKGGGWNEELKTTLSGDTGYFRGKNLDEAEGDFINIIYGEDNQSTEGNDPFKEAEGKGMLTQISNTEYRLQINYPDGSEFRNDIIKYEGPVPVTMKLGGEEFLYHSPDDGSKTEIHAFPGVIMNVLEEKEGWIKVNYSDEGKEQTGWVKATKTKPLVYRFNKCVF